MISGRYDVFCSNLHISLSQPPISYCSPKGAAPLNKHDFALCTPYLVRRVLLMSLTAHAPCTRYYLAHALCVGNYFVRAVYALLLSLFCVTLPYFTRLSQNIVNCQCLADHQLLICSPLTNHDILLKPVVQ